MNTIRCSMLPAWDDCSRRTAARQYWKILESKGHSIKVLLPSVGAAIGTAIHKAQSHFLLARLNGIQEPSQSDCFEVAEASLTAALAPGAVWDDTTPNMMVAEAQLFRMIAVLWPTLQDKRPKIVESELQATVPMVQGWVLSGHVDYFGESGDLVDLKTGVVDRNYAGQFGGYALILEANGHKVRTATVAYIKRVRLGTPAKPNPQPLPARFPYDIPDAKDTAWRAIKEIVQQMETYAASGKPSVLRANSTSLMCSEKYCPVWGTDFCTVHKKTEEK